MSHFDECECTCDRCHDRGCNKCDPEVIWWGIVKPTQWPISLYCPVVPGLICGRGSHSHCRERALAAIQQERKNWGLEAAGEP